jgi:hypothetical protein
MQSCKENRKGSAYIFVIGAISVLSILAIFFFKANTSRRYSTRMMSDEKKAEALAESAVDLVVGYIGEKMNDPTDPDYYLPFRFPCQLTQPTMGDNLGKNIPLDISYYEDIESFPQLVGGVSALSPIQYIIDELGGNDNVNLKVTISVPYAEAFSSKNPNYEVVGISEKSVTAGGASAEFLDSRSKLVAGGSDGPLSNLNSDWKLDFKLPNHTYEMKHKVYLPEAPGFAIKKDDVKITRLPPYDTSLIVLGELWIKVKAFGKTFVDITPADDNGSMTVDVMEYIKEYIGLEDDVTLLTMEALRDQAMEGDHNSDTLAWNASNLITEISDELDKMPGPIKAKIKSDPFGDGPQVVEKAGVLQIKAEVEYWPNGKKGKKIVKTLVAKRPFKVSDIQPPAPEYSFFVANSNLLFEGDDNPMGLSLGKAINWSPLYSVASVAIHNLPGAEYENCTGLSGSDGGAGKKAQVPGMVRINSRQEMKVNTYLGTLEEPYLTEFNALVHKPAMPNYKVLPTFRWNDSPTPNSQYEVHFPVIIETSMNDPWPCTGFRNLLSFLSVCNALEGPCQLFGNCFMEFPLGMCVEAPLKQKYGSMVFQVKPIGKKADPYDFSEIRITYKNKERKYGIEGKPGYSSISDWSPDRHECMPANVYSLLQYAKKATHFYRSEEDFWNDKSRFKDDVFDCTGVTYIKGNLNITDKLTVKGQGILVVKDNIFAKKDVIRDPSEPDTVFTLMARSGYLHVSGACNVIEASCYSNVAPMIAKTSKFEINGNLVVNEFDRGDVDYLEVNYNSAACRVTPLSIMRDVGKFEPKRYIVSIADNWTSYKFEKISSE